MHHLLGEINEEVNLGYGWMSGDAECLVQVLSSKY